MNLCTILMRLGRVDNFSDSCLSRLENACFSQSLWDPYWHHSLKGHGVAQEWGLQRVD